MHTNPTNINRTLIRKPNQTNSKAAFVLILLVLIFVVLTLAQDLLRAYLKNSAFYFSESFMFSSFWWLFAPFLFAQYSIIKHINRKKFQLQAALIIGPILLHLLVFPLLVWVLSGIFYYHTFSIQQTFKYTLSEDLYLLLLLYSIPMLTFQFFSTRAKLITAPGETESERLEKQFISNIIVSDGNKKQSIIVSEILYISANPPYINLHLEGKKNLHNETLKSVSTKLNPAEFVRVHKSTIVNINMVTSYTTRLNGDYDLKMKNDLQLRVSRNFAKDFKILFNKTHHLAIK